MKKTNKRIIRRMIAVTLSVMMTVTLINPMQVHANGIEDFWDEVIIISEGALEGYEASVISRMAGRAGASTINGAKGIAFEILYMDSENLANAFWIFKPETVIQLSESSIDEVADLVVYNTENEVVGLIQCKDCVSPAGIRNILEQVSSGKYDTAELVGTSDCASAFNKAAEKLGIEARMIDSGISDEVAKQIAEKSFGVSIKSIIEKVSSSSSIGAAVGGVSSFVESKINGDSDATTLGNVTTGLANGAVSTAAGTVTGELVTAGFVTIGASGAIATVAVFAAVIIAGTIVYTVIEKAEEKYNVKETLSNAYDTGLTVVADAYVDCEDAAQDGIEPVKENLSVAKDKFVTRAGDTVGFYKNVLNLGKFKK